MAISIVESAAIGAGGPEAAIRVVELSKQYASGTLANDRISLSVPEGTTLGLLGRNGAGKTTLVRQITGELRPTSGSVHVLGVDVIAEHTRARALMGVVPQEAEPFEHLRPREHLAFFGRLRGLSGGAARRRAAELVDQLGLSAHGKSQAQ